MARLPDVRTPVSPLDLARALRRAWEGEPPSTATLALLLAQWALETGHGMSCHNWNLGNAKAAATWSGDWTFFACNEYLSRAAADGAIARAGVRTDEDDGPDVVVKRYLPDGRAEVWFYPDNPGCRFEAFDDLDAGAAAHLALLRGRFASAWPAVLAGDAPAFCRALKLARYFTADLAPYQAAVVSLQAKFRRQLEQDDEQADVPPVVVDEELSPADRAAVLALVWQTESDSLNDEIRAAFRRSDDEA